MTREECVETYMQHIREGTIPSRWLIRQLKTEGYIPRRKYVRKVSIPSVPKEGYTNTCVNCGLPIERRIYRGKGKKYTERVKVYRKRKFCCMDCYQNYREKSLDLW